jgi:hypothetical protein
MKTHGDGGTSPCILNLGTRWRSVVSYIPRPPYSQGRTCEPGASLCGAKKWNIPGIEPRFLDCPTRRTVITLCVEAFVPCYGVNWLKEKRFWLVFGRCCVRISAGRLSWLRFIVGFLSPDSQVTRYSLKLCRNRFLPHRFQFFIHWSFYHSKLRTASSNKDVLCIFDSICGEFPAATRTVGCSTLLRPVLPLYSEHRFVTPRGGMPVRVRHFWEGNFPRWSAQLREDRVRQENRANLLKHTFTKMHFRSFIFIVQEWGFHGDSLLIWAMLLTFRRCILPPSSGSKRVGLVSVHVDVGSFADVSEVQSASTSESTYGRSVFILTWAVLPTCSPPHLQGRSE